MDVAKKQKASLQKKKKLPEKLSIKGLFEITVCVIN